MANSETSFRDRQAKSTLLKDTVQIFTPAFAPADSSISIVNFNLTIAGVDAANSNVELLASNYTTAATQRIALTKTVGAAITQALSYVKSNKAWDAQCKTAKMAADKFRGVRPPSQTAPAPDPGGNPPPPAEEKKRNQGQRAYAELAAHLESFLNAIMSCGGYTAPSTDITISAFSGHLSAFKGLNQFISALDGQLTTARALRYQLYFSEAGLQSKFQSIKDAVKGQYGQKSAQCEAVKTIKW